MLAKGQVEAGQLGTALTGHARDIIAPLAVHQLA